MRPVAIDATTLSILLNPRTGMPLDPATQAPVEFGRERILGFVAQMEKERRKLIIPTPATWREKETAVLRDFPMVEPRGIEPLTSTLPAVLFGRKTAGMR